ncbi:iron-containing alcohol dehydrogenase [Coriobacterium glomerans]|uniref:iron-containing alcohol dehydrogenase n=1 Tax=Coriobacterium glomerans TaxID=33871 RepID=UPI0005A015D1|nr:iron-containing alcohol dehydrogenase [Coriobacterium glomerans]
MSIRRQLLTSDSITVDYRVGIGALQQINRMVRSVMGKMRRALILYDPDISDDSLASVCEELRDLGIEPVSIKLSEGERIPTVAEASSVFESLAKAKINVDDAIIGYGDADLCSIVSFCAALWCGGTQALLIPTTLDAMVTAATSMRALDTAHAREMVFLQPSPALVLSDLAYVVGAPAESVRAGYVALLRSAIFGSRLSWERFGQQIRPILNRDEIAIADELISAQSSRLAVAKASNPSARHARSYGLTCARALRRCLGGDVADYALLAEGMRFEARLAHEVTQFDIDDVFAQDDYLEELGVAELRIDFDEAMFLEALTETSAAHSNRFLFALPRNPGTIRLTAVDTDVLERHVRAFLKSRSSGSVKG